MWRGMLMLLTVVCVLVYAVCASVERGDGGHIVCRTCLTGCLQGGAAIQTSSSSPPVFPSKLPLTGGSVESEPQLWVHVVGISAWLVP